MQHSLLQLPRIHACQRSVAIYTSKNIPTSYFHQAQRRTIAMSSATSFYDFKPLDSRFFVPLPLPNHLSYPHSCRATIQRQRLICLCLTEKGEPYPLSNLKGKVVLVVNTASKCGFTPQFEGLEKLYKKLKADGHTNDFEILGVPCNQFMQQDPVG